MLNFLVTGTLLAAGIDINPMSLRLKMHRCG
jgi:hypothetical protein